MSSRGDGGQCCSTRAGLRNSQRIPWSWGAALETSRCVAQLQHLLEEARSQRRPGAVREESLELIIRSERGSTFGTVEATRCYCEQQGGASEGFSSVRRLFVLNREF